MLTTAQCRQADELTIAGGVSGIDLMAQAGFVVARVVQNEYPDAPVALLVGPGNNGGDAIVAAIELQQAGCRVRLVCFGALDQMVGDARHFAGQWSGDIVEFADFTPRTDEVVIDGLFGSGYSRSLPQEVQYVFAGVAHNPVVAIDLPSGVHGDTGQVSEGAPMCSHTVTFFRLKPGHLLHPGREHCGVTHVCDIGIDHRCLNRIRPRYLCNQQPDFSRLVPASTSNKYARGCLAIVASGKMCGAAQLCARAAQRTGAGMVYILSPMETVHHYQQVLASVPTRSCLSPNEIVKHLSDPKISAIAIGPGLIEIEDDPGLLDLILQLEKPTVLDASAITALAHNLKMLENRKMPLVITPHAGEFKRLFPQSDTHDLPAALTQAARQLGCVLVYKGHTSLIAARDGTLVFNINASTDLATAGSGDVLTGIIGSLLAQGWSAKDAACAACWWHAESGQGFGLIAEDIIDFLPRIARYHMKESEA